MALDTLRMQRRFLRGHGLRLVLTIVALALGVALVAAMDIVNRAVLYAFAEVIDTMAGRAALQVTAGKGALFPEEIADEVSAVAGVELAVSVVSATAFTTDDSGDVLTVHGFELTRREATEVYEAAGGGLVLEDERAFLSQADSIAVTRTFAAKRALELGSPLVLDTSHGRRTFTVRGRSSLSAWRRSQSASSRRCCRRDARRGSRWAKRCGMSEEFAPSSPRDAKAAFQRAAFASLGGLCARSDCSTQKLEPRPASHAVASRNVSSSGRKRTPSSRSAGEES